MKGENHTQYFLINMTVMQVHNTENNSANDTKYMKIIYWHNVYKKSYVKMM